MWSLAGSDGTQSWEDRMRLDLGADLYEKLHWDLIALDGKIIVASMRNKSVGVAELPMGAGIPAEIYRTMQSINDGTSDEVEFRTEVPVPPAGKSATVNVLGRWIADEYIYKIHLLPNPRFCGSNRDDASPVFFRFDRGVGAVLPLRRS